MNPKSGKRTVRRTRSRPVPGPYEQCPSRAGVERFLGCGHNSGGRIVVGPRRFARTTGSFILGLSPLRPRRRRVLFRQTL